MADAQRRDGVPNSPPAAGASSTLPPEKVEAESRSSASEHDETQIPPLGHEGKREIDENECYDKLAYCWPTWKKWMYLSAVAFVQVSMNFNTSVFPNAVNKLSAYWHISPQEARTAQMIYLVTYSVGCELWAPWSEEFGRWPILQLSMFLINIWQIPCGVAPNWGTIVVCRGLVSYWL